MSARVDKTGRCIQLDRPAEPDENIAEEDAKDAGKLARLLMRILKDLAMLKRRFFPRQIDFEDRDVDGLGSSYRFTHNFNGRVRWWTVDARDGIPQLRRSDSTDANTLVLISESASVVTVRVQEAG